MRNTCLVVAIVSALTVVHAQPSSVAAPPVTDADIKKMMTTLSNWGRWGKDDQRGTLNLITPAIRKQALALVREGTAVSLAHTVDKTPAPDSPRPLGQQMTLDAG